MEVKKLQIWSHTRSKFRTTKLQIQGEQKHFIDIIKEWSKLIAVQVIELLFQQAGLANQININLSAFLNFFNRFSYWIWSWRRQVRDPEDEFISEWCKKMKDSQKLDIVSDYLKSNPTIVQLARKYSLKYSTVYSYIKNTKVDMQIVISGLNWIPWNLTNSFIVQKTIKGYIKSTKEGFTAKDIKNFVQKKHKILIPISMIIKFMKH